mmetsp:Transcript_82273/g.183467  ORF Transcript_82273/g.183467 Transcript_82273/m.183467 type:complete len:82 (-) Transcript_82273:298-543(-)
MARHGSSYGDNPLGSGLPFHLTRNPKLYFELIAQGALKVDDARCERVLDANLQRLPNLLALPGELPTDILCLVRHLLELGI